MDTPSLLPPNLMETPTYTHVWIMLTPLHILSFPAYFVLFGINGPFILLNESDSSICVMKYIHRHFKLNKMKHSKLPLELRMVRGAIGKEFVIKHYDYGIIKTKFPDMTKIVATSAQRKCRNLFAEAVKFANSIKRDPQLKKEWAQ